MTGADVSGNSVDTSDVVLRPSLDPDVVAGSAVTFQYASPNTITATIGAVSASVTIQVMAAAAPSPGPTPAWLVRSGVDGGAVRLGSVVALTHLLAGGVLLAFRRTRRHTR
ncbi:hypothetical protein [Microbacterium testaceum]|uniref:hypothetical protein n=1 Tax=Microbacterium testaceum TaxID=2033 RepID=UPI00243574C0|nr:hypothetical protein [Microbacterium testaceum]